jgi:hypothetical protein
VRQVEDLEQDGQRDLGQADGVEDVAQGGDDVVDAVKTDERPTRRTAG